MYSDIAKHDNMGEVGEVTSSVHDIYLRNHLRKSDTSHAYVLKVIP